MGQTEYRVIAVTGCAGLIGSHISFALLDRGIKVIGIDNLVGGYFTNMPWHPDFIFNNVSIENHSALKDLFSYYEVDAVIHCAALAHEGLSVFSPFTIASNIYSGTLSVASAAIAANAKVFINTSSMARYGNIQAPFIESQVPNPVDPYGYAKLQAEQQLNLLSTIHGIKVIHMVPHNVCGPHQCYSDPFRNVLSIFTNRALKDSPIYIYGTGEQKRSFSHVKDCVKAYLAVLDNQHTIDNFSVFNIGPDHGSEITINALASMVGVYLNKNIDIINMPARPCEVVDAWVDTSKAKEQLNYTTEHSVQDTVRDTITWIRNEPERSFNYHIPLEIINEHTPKTWTDKLFNK